MTKWQSPSRKVLQNYPPEDPAISQMDLQVDRLPNESALGIHWDCETDEFLFVFEPDQETLTPRQLLSRISSMFDPLGILALMAARLVTTV